MQKQNSHNLPKFIMTMTIILLIGTLLGMMGYLVKNKEAQKTVIKKYLDINNKDLTVKSLKNAEYNSIFWKNETIKLKDGSYTRKYSDSASVGYVGIFDNKILFKDLNGDGEKDAVIILDSSFGGTGHFYELVVVVNKNGEPLQIASENLGDRSIINSLEINDGKIIIDMITHGPMDGGCCPTLRKVFEYELKENELVIISEKELVDNEDWKIYKNEEYEFEFKHPENWLIKKHDITEMLYATTEDIEEMKKRYSGGVPYLMTISIYKNTEEFIAGYNYKDFNLNNIEDYLEKYSNVEDPHIDNIKTINTLDTKVYSADILDYGGGKNYYIQESNHLYVVWFFTSTEHYSEELAKQILSTFKFIDEKDETVEWNVYSNPEVDFTFKYPKDWEITQDYFYTWLNGKVSDTRTVVLRKIGDEASNDWININMRQFQCDWGTCKDLGSNTIGTYSEDPETLRVFDKIIATFKFTDSKCINNSQGVEIIAPTENSEWERGENYQIKWKSFGCEDEFVGIRLYKLPAVSLNLIWEENTNSIPPTKGFYDFNVFDSLEPGKYKLIMNGNSSVEFNIK
ncbi:hypothetical protein K0B03_04500 [Patescibacteria group bacterium]|nr:hypothetical protein [Patescibacteria group bacterium]